MEPLKIWEALKPLAPIIIGLLGGGSIFGFLLALLNRHDRHAARQDNLDRIMSNRGRVYELAFRKQDAWARNIVQTCVSFAIAHRSGESEMARAFAQILCTMFLDESPGDILGYKLKKFPDFIEEARREIDNVDGDDPIEPEPPKVAA